MRHLTRFSDCKRVTLTSIPPISTLNADEETTAALEAGHCSDELVIEDNRVYNIYSRSYYEGCGLRPIKRLQLRHETHPLPSLLALEIRPHDTTSAAINDMLSQHTHNLAVLPPLRDRSIGGLEGANRLRPLTAPRCTRDPPPVRLTYRSAVRSSLRLLCGCLPLHVRRSEVRTSTFSVGERRRRRLLSSPVIDIPIVLVEEKVVLL